jgi:TonB family protein
MECSFAKALTRIALAGAVLFCTAAAFGQEAQRISGTAALGAAIARPAPEMPMIAKQLKLTGTVELDVVIDETGSVEKADLLRGNPVLAKAAQDGVKKWKFKPFKDGDKAMKVVTTLNFDFKS